jgi:ribosomal protein S26
MWWGVRPFFAYEVFLTEKHGCTHYHLKRVFCVSCDAGVLNVYISIADVRADELRKNSDLFAKNFARVKTTCD